MFASFWNMNHNITCTRKILMKFKVTDDYMILQLIFKLTTYDCSGTNIRILPLPYRLKKTRQQVSYVQKINQFEVPKNHWWRKRPTWQCRLVAPTSKTGMPPGLSRRMKRWTFLFWSSLTWSNVSFPNLNQDQVQSDHIYVGAPATAGHFTHSAGDSTFNGFKSWRFLQRWCLHMPCPYSTCAKYVCKICIANAKSGKRVL